MKVVSTEALTKLIQLVKSAFISVDDTVETSEVDVYTKNEVDNLTLGGNLYGNVVVDNEFICAPYLCWGNKFITSFSAPNCTRAILHGGFTNCSNLTSVNLSKVEHLNASPGQESYSSDTGIFARSGIVSMDFESLTDLTDINALRYAFAYSPIQEIWFRALTSSSFPPSTEWYYQDGMGNMLEGCSNVTVHFPSNLQSVIGSWWVITDGFSGTNTTILFDLPATE